MKLKLIIFISLLLILSLFAASKDQYFLAYLDYLHLNSMNLVGEIQWQKGQYKNIQRKVVWNSRNLKVEPPQISYQSEAEDRVLAADANTWIDINLSTQTLCLMQNDGQTCFLVSTGLYAPTPTGTFSIWTKLSSTLMRGPGYYLPGVPWTMYFYKGYGIHGTYWHNNFGHPMSHGCVNMRTPEAQFVFDRVSVGTRVVVHY